MVDHLKKWWALHATLIFALLTVIGSTMSSYLKEHPHATIAGLFGAIGWSAITLLMRSPTQS